MGDDLRDISRKRWSMRTASPCEDEIRNGALQRIADACELMARRYTDLLDAKMRAEGERDHFRKRCETAEKRIAAYRGVISRMKREGN